MNSEHNIQLCIQCALPVVTIMALWQLLNLGTGCTVTHCWIALWSHESAQTNIYIYIYIYLTIIPRARVGYEVMGSQRGA